jgi:hypothetical protein
VDGRSVHVVSAMLPISGQTFFGGGFCIFSREAPFFWEFFFCFSERAKNQGGICIP